MDNYGPQGGWQPQQPQQPPNPWANQWGQQQAYYPTQPQQQYELPADSNLKAKKDILSQDIPLSYVVIGTLVIWVLIFSGVFGYMMTNPCGFVMITVGDGETLTELESRFGMDLRREPSNCRTFINHMIMGTTPT